MTVPRPTPFHRAMQRYLTRLRRDARRAARELGPDAPAETLHDFRVAVRRARSWLQSFRAEFGTTKSRVHALGKLTRLTNTARDLEVEIDWLHKHSHSRSRAVRRAAQRRLEACTCELRDETGALLPKLRHRWRRAALCLEFLERTDRLTAERWAAVVMARTAKLVSALRAIDSPNALTRLHRARIAAKRVRYLLEPFDADAHVAAVIAQLRRVQDDLGRLNDLAVLTRRWTARSPHIAALRRVARREYAAGFQRVRARLLGAGIASLQRTITVAVRRVHTDAARRSRPVSPAR